MKQKLLNFLLLTALIVFGSGGAWADNETLSPSLMLTINSNGNVVTSNGACAINQTDISGGKFRYNGPVALIKFDAKSNLRGRILQKATFTFDITAGAYNSSMNLWLIKKTDWAATNAAWNTAYEFTQITRASDWSEKNKTKSFSYDVTNLVKSDADTIYGFALGTNTTREQTLKNVKLTLEHIDASNAANYTIKYVDVNNNEIKTSIQVIGVINEAIALKATDKADFTVNNKKYIYVSDDSENKTVAANGSTVVTIKFREAATYNYSIKAVSGSTELKTLLTGSSSEGETINYPYPQYLTKDGKLYKSSKQNSDPWWGKSFALTADNQSVTVSYTEQSKTGIVFYSEAEDLIDATKVTGNNANIRCSMCAGGYFGGENKTVTTLTPGKYKLYTSVWGNPGVTFTFSADGNNILSAETKGYIQDYESDEFVITNETAITMTGGDAGKVIDFVYIQRTGDAPFETGALIADTLTSATSTWLLDGTNNGAVIGTVTMTGATLESDGGAKFLKFSTGGTLTLTSTADGLGFGKIVLNASKLNGANATWTSTTAEKTVTFNFTGETRLNSIFIGETNDGYSSSSAINKTTIADVKDTGSGNTAWMKLDGYILAVDGDSIIVQDQTGGIAIRGINIAGAAAGKKVTFDGLQVTPFYQPYPKAPVAVNAEFTNNTRTTVANATEWPEPKILSVAEATNDQNVYTLVTLKGVTISVDGNSILATDKEGNQITLDNRFYADLADNEEMSSGNVLASLTGVTIYTNNGVVLAPRNGEDIVGGLLWKSDDMVNGEEPNISLTDEESLAKLADLKAGDVIKMELSRLGSFKVLTAADIRIFERSVSTQGVTSVDIPITADVVEDIKKHGLKIQGSSLGGLNDAEHGNHQPVKATMLTLEPCTQAIADDIIWFDNSGSDIQRFYLGEAHFEDVREGDIITSTSSTDASISIANNPDITSGVALTAEQAEKLTDSYLSYSQPANMSIVQNITLVTFTKVAARDDKAEAQEGEAYAQGDKVQTNGMIMTFGGNEPEGKKYQFTEQYPEVNKFGGVTEGISQAPTDAEDKTFAKDEKNVPTKGTYYQFDALKDGQLEVTVGVEKGKTIVVTEDGEVAEPATEALAAVDGKPNVENKKVTVAVKATKSYYVFSPESNLQYYGFKFTPANSEAGNKAKDIATFKLLPAEGVADTLLLKDAVVNYIKGDDVFVSDATGAIDIYQTHIQFYVGQVLNGYIVGKNGFDRKLVYLPQLQRTDATKYGQFKVTEDVTPEPAVISVADIAKQENLNKFVKIENISLSHDKRGFQVLTDGENSIRVEDRFNVFYDLPARMESINGIVGINSDSTYIFWPTAKDAVVPAGIPADFADGKYYIANLSAAIQADYAYFGVGNSWGTQASLVKHPEYVTLHKVGEGKYTLESQVSNGGNNIYFNGDFMDNNQPMTLTITRTKEPINDIEDEDDEPVYGYYIANEKSYFGWDGQSSVLGKGLSQDDDNAVWIIASEEEVKSSLLMAAEDDPQDATFLLLDPNFGRNNRWGKDLSTNAKVFANADLGAAWTFEASNKNNSGDNTNWCVESWHSTFNMSQTITDVPNGVYELTAQGFYRQDGEDNDNLPVFYINDQTAEFPLMTGTENSMTDASHSFSEGKYTIDPIRVIVKDGTITVGAKNEANVNLWCIWDNFELNYYGPAEDVETGSETELDIVNADDAKTKNNAIEGIAITIDGTYNAGTGSAMAGDMTSKGYKLRTNNGSDPKNSVVVNVNEGYTVTNFTINAISNYAQKDGVDAELPNVFVTKVEVDGKETSFNGGEFPAKGANDCGTLTIDGIKAKESIKIYFDNSNSAGQQLNMAYYVEWQKGEASKPLSSELVHTASSSCGGDANTYVSTVDAEKEHVNNEKFNAVWQGAAYAEFAFNVPDGQTVTNATFRFTAIGESRRARPAIVYVVNAGETLDYDAMTAGDAKVNLAGTKVADVTFPQNTSEVLEVDVTEALNTIIEAGQNFIIFKVTGNAGGGDMAGMASENAPELVITTDSESTGIKTIEAPTRTIEGVYTLSGQKVGDTTEGLKPGLYIVNGRKMIVK